MYEAHPSCYCMVQLYIILFDDLFILMSPPLVSGPKTPMFGHCDCLQTPTMADQWPCSLFMVSAIEIIRLAPASRFTGVLSGQLNLVDFQCGIYWIEPVQSLNRACPKSSLSLCCRMEVSYYGQCSQNQLKRKDYMGDNLAEYTYFILMTILREEWVHCSVHIIPLQMFIHHSSWVYVLILKSLNNDKDFPRLYLGTWVTKLKSIGLSKCVWVYMS